MLRNLVPLAALLTALAGCVSPTASFKARAILAGLSETTVKGDAFDHAAFRNSAAIRMASGRPAVQPRERLLHIYVDGDGRPYRTGRPDRPTRDPTPRNPITLDLIALDKQPSVLLGRPCFDGLSRRPPCETMYWNDLRYSEPVVASMTAAMNRLIAQMNADGVILFGVSGGGALAVLMADRSAKVRGVVTVAANLDLTAWSAYHRPANKIDLTAWWARHKMPGPGDVLNPATDGRRHVAQHRGVFERHYAGGRDRVVPPATQIRGLRSLREQVVIPDYDHNCCWARMWPRILTDVERAMGVGVAASH
jgi:pimeloyl-ACP methyl ester carboxylesterase